MADPVATPEISPAELVLLVPKREKDPAGNEAPYTHPTRRPIKLQVTGAEFDGDATLRCSEPALVKLYGEDGAEITFNGTDNVFRGPRLASGIELQAEAVAPSDAMNDVALTLSLSGGTSQSGPDFVARATCVEVTLDIWDRPRLQEGESTERDPRPLSTEDKIRAGGRLFIQSGTGRFERAKLVIQRVKPSAFDGALVLEARRGAAVFLHERPTPGEKPLADELPAAEIPSDGMTLWAEGVEDASDPLKKKFVGNSSFALKVKGIEDVADVVHATVRPNVFLTFDDGPSAACESVVRELDAAGFRATFFVNLQNMSRNPAEQRRILGLIVGSNHALGNHGYVHRPYLLSEYNAEIASAEAQSPKKDPTDGVCNNFALNNEKAKALLGDDFPGLELARLPGAGSKSRFKASDGTPVDFVQRVVDELNVCHATWDFELYPNGVFGRDPNRLEKVDWNGISGVSAEAKSDRLPALNNIIMLFHDAHWAGKADRLRALFTFLRNETNVIPLLPPPRGHRAIRYPADRVA